MAKKKNTRAGKEKIGKERKNRVVTRKLRNVLQPHKQTLPPKKGGGNGGSDAA